MAKLTFATLVALPITCLAPFLFGLTFGFTGPAIGTMSDPNSPDYVLTSDNYKSLFGSMVNIGALFGVILGGSLMNTLGRTKF